MFVYCFCFIFLIALTTIPQVYLNGFSTETPTIQSSKSFSGPVQTELNGSVATHYYDDPNVLNLVQFNRSLDALHARGGTWTKDGQDYITMSGNIRTNTPSSVASDRSQYSHPRSVPRYQSPSTNQRYDSPRSIAAFSEYDDPTNVLNRTVSPFENDFMLLYFLTASY